MKKINMKSIVFGKEIIMKKINMKSIVFGKEIIMKKIKMKNRFGFIGTLMVAIFALTGVAYADGHLKFPIGEGEFSWDTYHAFAMEHDYTGQQLTVTTRFAGGPGDNLYESMKYFAEATGADVRHNGTQNFKQEVTTNLEAGSPANVTAFSLVGFLAGMAKRGFLTPLCSDLADCDLADYIRNTYASGESFVKYGSAKGPDGKDHFYGVAFQVYFDSLIYTSPKTSRTRATKSRRPWKNCMRWLLGSLPTAKNRGAMVCLLRFDGFYGTNVHGRIIAAQRAY